MSLYMLLFTQCAFFTGRASITQCATFKLCAHFTQLQPSEFSSFLDHVFLCFCFVEHVHHDPKHRNIDPAVGIGEDVYLTYSLLIELPEYLRRILTQELNDVNITINPMCLWTATNGSVLL